MTAKLRTACRIGLGLTLLVAGVMKVIHPADFFSDLLGFRVPFPERFLRFVAVCLPWLEVCVGLGLLLDFWRETVRPVAALLCLVFVAMLAQAVGRGLDLNCGCFGAGAAGWFERPGVALARAFILLGAAIYVAADGR